MDKTLKAMLERHEGRRTHPYTCTAGKLTIGVGHNIEDRGLSDTVIDMILEEDVSEAIANLLYAISLVHVDPPSPRTAALIDMMFKSFKRMIDAINDGDWAKAASEALDSQWARQVGDRATEIAHMLRNNTYYTEGGTP